MRARLEEDGKSAGNVRRWRENGMGCGVEGRIPPDADRILLYLTGWGTNSRSVR